MSPRVVLVLALLVATPVVLERTAAADASAEAGAKEALKKAEEDYRRTAFNTALKRLLAAELACGETGCSPAVRAALSRDVGVMQIGLDEREKAVAAFSRAKGLDPTIVLSALYATADVRQAWDSAAALAPATPMSQPVARDFTHAPAVEQQTRTPLPVYVVPTTTEALASVVVRYKSASTRSFRRAPLKRIGEGWGGYIPCADVVRGTITYYIQGFDAAGELVASGGDLRSTFAVPIRESIATPAPALPGLAAPTKCSDEDLEVLNLAEGDRCQEDRQCKSGACAAGRCQRARAIDREETEGPREFARLWIGIAGSLDLTVPPQESDACATAAGVSTTSYWCTTPSGNDYPSSAAAGSALITGRGGSAPGDLTTGGVHVTASIDYAISASLLVGLRIGYVAGAYPGTTAIDEGKTFAPRLHFEARGTWLFGDQPLAHSGLAPYVFGGGGAARFDTATTVIVGERGVTGGRPVQAWRVAGPAFAAIGGGARYAFSPRAAFSTGFGFDLAIGPGALTPLLSPEMSFQYGF